jgi:uncharacterized protein (DUF1015 family)
MVNIRTLAARSTDEAEVNRIARTAGEWRSDRLILADDAPRFYLYEMTNLQDPSRRVSGVVGALLLDKEEQRVVPHEETTSLGFERWVTSLAASQMNIDPIIGLSGSRDLGPLLQRSGRVRRRLVDSDGWVHTISDIVDAEQIQAISLVVAERPVSLADGHHRYHAALAYASSIGSQPDDPSNSILAFISTSDSSGLGIHPFHRLLPNRDTIDITSLARDFVVTPGQPTPPRRPGSIVLLTGDDMWDLAPLPTHLMAMPSPWRRASSAVAQTLLYPLLGLTEADCTYTTSVESALAHADGGAPALLMAPLDGSTIAEAGRLGLRFPQKTTFFSPKPRAGLVLRSIG